MCKISLNFIKRISVFVAFWFHSGNDRILKGTYVVWICYDRKLKVTLMHILMKYNAT